MAKCEERGQLASARKLPSDHRPQFSQAPRPGTPFPFPQRDDDTPPKWGKHLTRTKDPCDFPPPGVIRLTWHKFRKRVASRLGPIPGKGKRSLTMSTVLEEPMDFDQLGTRVTASSLGHCAGDASEKFKEDDTVPGPSSADSSTDQ
ncbi:hypothetical protein A6R68_21874, partial [Neotoma lepida]